jgi:hypothetical protein
MANSKNIGNTYEREVAKKLSLWLTNNQDDDVCWRDLGSGSRHTQRKKVGKETKRQGDFVATDLNYQWFFDFACVDSKSYKEWNSIFINEKNIKSNSILNQWFKLCNESDNKLPMMICHIRDRRTPEFIILPSTTIYPYKADINLMYYSFRPELQINDFALVLLDQFFEKINVEEFYRLNNTEK